MKHVMNHGLMNARRPSVPEADVHIALASHVQFTPSPATDEGLLVDRREHLLIRFNRSGWTAWEALETGRWQEARKSFAEVAGLKLDEAGTILWTFAEDLASKGWIVLAPSPS